MPKFSSKSASRLATCHPDLQKLFNEVIKTKDCVIICGARTLEEQIKAYQGGFSKLDGVIKKSKHQVSPERPLSLAVDILPYPLRWDDALGHLVFADYVKLIANKMEIDVVWGGDWKRFPDAPHWELKYS